MTNNTQNNTDFINWVVRALNADWLTAVVYQTVYHGNVKTYIFTALITLVTPFIIAIRLLGCFWCMAKIPRLRTVSRHSVMNLA